MFKFFIIEVSECSVVMANLVLMRSLLNAVDIISKSCEGAELFCTYHASHNETAHCSSPI